MTTIDKAPETGKTTIDGPRRVATTKQILFGVFCIGVILTILYFVDPNRVTKKAEVPTPAPIVLVG